MLVRQPMFTFSTWVRGRRQKPRSDGSVHCTDSHVADSMPVRNRFVNTRFLASGARILILSCIGSAAVMAAEADALAISANIQARHMPFGTILDPVFASPTNTAIVGYTRCGDSALWTGAYLAAEAFRYKVTQSPDALTNVRTALAGLKALVDVTGN